MLPAFGMPESKALLPVFRHYAEQVRFIIIIDRQRRTSTDRPAWVTGHLEMEGLVDWPVGRLGHGQRA